MEQIRKCGKEEKAYVLEGLQEYNRQFITAQEREDCSFYVGGEGGACFAGVVATKNVDCIFVHYLFVAQTQRQKGYGSRLLEHLEAYAVENKVKRITLDTFSFQALEFYKKNGYQVFGSLTPCFGSYSQYFLVKELASC